MHCVTKEDNKNREIMYNNEEYLLKKAKCSIRNFFICL